MWLSETVLKCGLFAISTGEVSWQSAGDGMVRHDKCLRTDDFKVYHVTLLSPVYLMH